LLLELLDLLLVVGLELLDVLVDPVQLIELQHGAVSGCLEGEATFLSSPSSAAIIRRKLSISSTDIFPLDIGRGNW